MERGARTLRRWTRRSAETRTSRRSVELDAGTVTLLSRWRRRLQRDGLPAGIDARMFCNTAGRYPTRSR